MRTSGKRVVVALHDDETAGDHVGSIRAAASKIRLVTGDCPAVRGKLAELIAALDQYRAETDQGLMGTMAMRRAFAALDDVRREFGDS